jgi:hypothetical protein
MKQYTQSFGKNQEKKRVIMGCCSGIMGKKVKIEFLAGVNEMGHPGEVTVDIKIFGTSRIEDSGLETFGFLYFTG